MTAPGRRVEAPEAAEALVHRAQRDMLAPFIGRERSLSEAAGEVGISLSGMAYHVQRFLRLGLLEVVREVARKGRAVKIYRASSDAFFIPYRVVAYESVEALIHGEAQPYLRESADAVARAYERLLEADWGLSVYRRPEGKVVFEFTTADGTRLDLLGPASPAVWLSLGRLLLGFQDAKALQREMAELWLRYMEKAGARKGKTYFVQLSLAPKP